MKLPHPYDLIIGLDRSDKKADLWDLSASVTLTLPTCSLTPASRR
jgi:hypothetical protein